LSKSLLLDCIEAFNKRSTNEKLKVQAHVDEAVLQVRIQAQKDELEADTKMALKDQIDSQVIYN
jgi:hypothetical protein